MTLWVHLSSLLSTGFLFTSAFHTLPRSLIWLLVIPMIQLSALPISRRNGVLLSWGWRKEADAISGVVEGFQLLLNMLFYSESESIHILKSTSTDFKTQNPVSHILSPPLLLPQMLGYLSVGYHVVLHACTSCTSWPCRPHTFTAGTQLQS